MGCVESISRIEDLSYYDEMTTDELQAEVNKLQTKIRRYNHQIRCYNCPEYYHVMVQISDKRQDLIDTIRYIEKLHQYHH